jgi:hypothetical protein
MKWRKPWNGKIPLGAAKILLGAMRRRDQRNIFFVGCNEIFVGDNRGMRRYHAGDMQSTEGAK